MAIRFDTGEFADILRWSQTAVDLAGGDPALGSAYVVGSPLAVALVWRGIGGFWLGRSGWREDFGDAVAMARTAIRQPTPQSSHISTALRSPTGCSGLTIPRCAR